MTPGFVDPHTHYDGQATWDPLLAPSSHHGVTTVAMGNCGVGFAPVAPDRHDWLIAMMEGVEDIPGTALHEGLRWDWESFPEYLDALERQPRAIDVGTHLPHAALRAFVMGERGADPGEHPDEQQLGEMARLLEQGLDAGAIGVSTSRTERHRTSTGENLGTLRAREPELLALASVLRATGKGVFQFLSDSYRTTSDAFAASEFALITEFARASGRPVSYTVQQDIEAPDRWRDLIEPGRFAPGRGSRRQGPGGAPPHRRPPRPRSLRQCVHPGPRLRQDRRPAPGRAHRRPGGPRPPHAHSRGSRHPDVGCRRLRGVLVLRALRRHVRARRSAELRPRPQPVVGGHGPPPGARSP